MSGFRAFLPCLIYVVPAALIALGLPPRVSDLGPGMALIFGMLVLLGGALLHLGYALLRARERADGEAAGAMEAVAHLERVQRRLEGDFAQMRNALADLQSRPEQNVGAVVAEVKVLQSLVERLYSARAAVPEPAAAPSPAAAAKPATPAAPATNGSAMGGPSLPMPPVAEGLDEQEILDLVREGLRENAVELALQPIVSLPQRKRRFFECFSRVRTHDGGVIVPEQYLAVAASSDSSMWPAGSRRASTAAGARSTSTPPCTRTSCAFTWGRPTKSTSRAPVRCRRTCGSAWSSP